MPAVDGNTRESRSNRPPLITYPADDRVRQFVHNVYREDSVTIADLCQIATVPGDAVPLVHFRMF